jgi:hypothetical protein
LKISQTKYWSIGMANGWTGARKPRQRELIRQLAALGAVNRAEDGAR